VRDFARSKNLLKAKERVLMNISEIQQKLHFRRNEILGIVEKVGKHIGHRDEPLHPDSAERAVELENMDALFEIDSETRYELKLINDALARIESGRYGFCTLCGSTIDPKRIKAIPYIDTCFSCA